MFNYTASVNACTPTIIIWLSVALIIDSFFIISSLIFICKFIIHFVKESKKTSKLLFYSGILFFMVSLVTLILSIPCNFKCGYKALFDEIDITIKGVYSFHNYLMVILWSLRLYVTFKNVVTFKLSKPTLIFFAINAFLGPIGLLYMIFWHTSTNHIGRLVMMIALCLFLSWTVFLESLFIYKLIQVYRNLTKMHTLIKLSTKITILSIVSMVFTVIFLLTFAITGTFWADNIHSIMIRDLVHLISIYINVICIMFSYDCIDPNYQFICGGMNRLCTNIWYNCLGIKAQSRKGTRIPSTTQGTISQTSNI